MVSRVRLKSNQVLGFASRKTQQRFAVRNLIHHAIICVSGIAWVLCRRRKKALSSNCVLTNQDFSEVHVSQSVSIWRWIRGNGWVGGIQCKVNSISIHGRNKLTVSEILGIDPNLNRVMANVLRLPLKLNRRSAIRLYWNHRETGTMKEAYSLKREQQYSTKTNDCFRLHIVPGSY